MKKGAYRQDRYREYLDLARDWQIRPYLEEELVKAGRIPEREEQRPEYMIR